MEAFLEQIRENAKKEIYPWAKWIEKQIVLWLKQSKVNRLELLFQDPIYKIEGMFVQKGLI